MFVTVKDTSIYQKQMKPIKKLVLASFVFAIGMPAEAQYLWDVGVHVGGANYLGEMGGVEKTRRDFIWDMKMSQTSYAVGAFARRKLTRMVSVNAGVMHIRIQGADALSTNRERFGRNLNFRNSLTEVYFRPEVTVFQDNDFGGRGTYKTDFRMFAYIGAAAYIHNPQGQINRSGEFYDLQPLNTELADYSLTGLAVPVGLGFHVTKKRRHRIGFDFGWRTTFTDYLDDVSTTYINPELLKDGPGGLAHQLQDQSSYVYEANPDYPIGPEQYGYTDEGGESPPSNNRRGDPTHNDSYLTTTVTYSYVLRGQSNFYRQRYSWVRGKKRIGRKSRAKF